jgi:hypothetical protein
MITLLYSRGSYLPGHENTSAFFMVEVVSSRDLKKWHPTREIFLKPSRMEKGVVQPVNRPITHEGELWFYYSGGKEHQSLLSDLGRYSTYMDGIPHGPESFSDLERAEIEAGQSAIYLATLRFDGFVSLNADSEAGYLLTKPL